MKPSDLLQDYRGFTDSFAQEFVVPQISFWLEHIYRKPDGASGLEKEYYQGMETAARKLLEEFSPPYKKQAAFPFHEVVVTVNEVEMLKGIIGDNYRYLQNKISQKEKLSASFLNTETEQESVKKIDLYLNHIAPSLLDALEKKFYVVYSALTKNIERHRDDVDHYDLFLCHSSEDKSIVRQFYELFAVEGLQAWLDEAEILPGDNIINKIAKGLERARYVIVFISPNLNLENISPFANFELTTAKMKELQGKDDYIIPVLIGDGDVSVPTEVQNKNYADFRNTSPERDHPEFQRLLKKIDK